jgi:dTMP kinase
MTDVLPAAGQQRQRMFITFEGVEGCGKTVQARLLVDHLRQLGLTVVLTREPGGTEIGDQIRTVLHDTGNTAMLPTSEILLYSAARAQIVGQLIRPALVAGQVVVCDRYADSTLAYQGYGRGLDLDVLRYITAFATGGLRPDLTLMLDVDVEAGLTRKRAAFRAQQDELNRMDQQTMDFYSRVREGYRTLVAQEPGRWVVIDAARDIVAIQNEIQAVVAPRLRPQR